MGWWQDFRYAFRMHAKHPALPLAAVLVLGLGLGVNLAVLLLVNTVLLRPMPGIGDARTLAVIGRTFEKGDDQFPFGLFSLPDYEDVRKGAGTIESTAGYRMMHFALSADNHTERLRGEAATGSYAALLRLKVNQGRWFNDNEGDVMAVSKRLAMRRWNSIEAAVGKKVTLNGVPFTVVGVVEGGFRGSHLLGDADVWIPLDRSDAVDRTVANQACRDCAWMYVLARLKPGATLEQAAAELQALGVALREKHAPDFKEMSFGIARYTPLHQPLRWNNVTAFMAILTGLTLTGVLVVCANAANLLLARMASRRREFVIRLAVGAGRLAILRLCLAEGLLLGALGVLIGALSAASTSDWLASMLPPDGGNRVVLSIQWDAWMALYAVALTFLTTLTMTLPAAFQAAKADLLVGLRAGETSQVAARTGLRSALATGQVALCLLLVTVAGLASRSLLKFRTETAASAASRIAVGTVDLSLNGYTQPLAKSLFRSLRERLSGLPGVEAAALSSAEPYSGGSRSVFALTTSQQKRVQHTATSFQSAGIFHVMGIPLLAGRDFSASDEAPGRPLVAVVNESLARTLFPDSPALGQLIQTGDKTYPSLEVIGIVNDSVLDVGEPEQHRPLRLFLNLHQYDNWNLTQTIHVRVRAGDAAAVREIHPAIRAVLAGLDAHVPVVRQQTLAVSIEENQATQRLMASISGYTSVMGLLVATIGLYGLIAFSVSQARREIGLRIALGASNGDILRRVLRQSAWIGGIGIGFGVLLSAAVTRLLEGAIHGVQGLEPGALAASAGVLAAAILAASLVPARRALAIQPADALRQD